MLDCIARFNFIPNFEALARDETKPVPEKNKSCYDFIQKVNKVLTVYQTLKQKSSVGDVYNDEDILQFAFGNVKDKLRDLFHKETKNTFKNILNESDKIVVNEGYEVKPTSLKHIVIPNTQIKVLEGMETEAKYLSERQKLESSVTSTTIAKAAMC